MVETKGNVNFIDCVSFEKRVLISVASEDNRIVLYDLEKERSFLPSINDSHDSQTIFTKLQKDLNHVGSIASDGSFLLYKIEGDEVRMVKKAIISNEIKEGRNKMTLGFDFLGEFEIVLSGKDTLQRLSYDKSNNDYNMSLVEEINHSDKIINVLAFENNTTMKRGLVTVSKDNVLKIWAKTSSESKYILEGDYCLEETVQKLVYDETSDSVY